MSTKSAVPVLSLLVGLLAAPGAHAADATKGQAVYTANCMACHGVNADGKGPAAAALKPAPTDFTSAAFWQGRTNEQVKSAIRTGKPGTPMMAFGKLSEGDLDNLVAFLETKKP
jgi:high-affinity iron transporter